MCFIQIGSYLLESVVKKNIPLLLKAVTCVIALQFASLEPVAAASSNFRTISSASEFERYIVGKRLHRQNSSFFVNADGTITGVYGGSELRGRWEWDQELNAFCLLLSHPARRYNCKTVEIDETDNLTMRFRRSRS